MGQGQGVVWSGGQGLSSVEGGACDLVVVQEELDACVSVGDESFVWRCAGAQRGIASHDGELEAAFGVVEQCLEDAGAASESAEHGAFA
ncbi:Uncharacterised protein [Mycobacteroides abscessus subsp. abscessus]|nr:Uncharacterised protein [Mycobacteroides abscessus subsp. abscessus]